MKKVGVEFDLEHLDATVLHSIHRVIKFLVLQAGLELLL